METARVQQAHTEVSPVSQKGFDSLMARLASLEEKLRQTTQMVEGLKQPQGEFKPQHPPATSEDRTQKKTVRCFRCKGLGNFKRNCPLNSQGSVVRSAPTSQ